MATTALSTLALFAGLAIKQASSSPVSLFALAPRSPPGYDKPCTSFTLPVPITVNQHVYDIVHVDSNIDAASYEIDIDTWNSKTFPERIIDNITISKTYNIYATLCVPPNGSKKNLLQLATHGGGFDSRYWDSEVEPEKYSYVKAALDAGYSILTYDRLTTGNSDHPDAYREGQLGAEVEIVRSLTEIIRAGKLETYAPNAISWDKIIHVGHSIGSIITYLLSSFYPELSDAIVLTGFVPSKEQPTIKTSSQDFQYAPEADPVLFADSSSGYIVPGTKNSLQFGFFSTLADNKTGLGGFDPKLLDYAYSIRQPITVTEIGSGISLLIDNPSAPKFTGPAFFIAGIYDYLFCAGYCPGTFDQKTIDAMYPKAADATYYLQPGTGHGLPFHRGAKSGFQKTFDWLAKNGF